MKKEQIFLAVLMFVVLLISRLVPHPANFTALTAVGLFGGSYWRRSQLKFVVPLLALFLTDAYLGFYPGIVFTYVAVALGVIVAPLLSASLWNVLARGVLASVLFFVVSNLGVWWSSGMYAPTLAGLVDCYVMALPFFHNTLISTAFYSVVLFGFYRAVFFESRFDGFFELTNGRYQR